MWLAQNCEREVLVPSVDGFRGFAITSIIDYDRLEWWRIYLLAQRMETSFDCLPVVVQCNDDAKIRQVSEHEDCDLLAARPVGHSTMHDRNSGSQVSIRSLAHYFNKHAVR
jgi:hypothetical protein